MLSIYSNGNNVEIKATFKIRSEEYWVKLSHNRGGEIDARLLAEKLESEFEERVSKIRKAAYELGWADKQSKRKAKKTSFSSDFKTDFVGY